MSSHRNGQSFGIYCLKMDKLRTENTNLYYKIHKFLRKNFKKSGICSNCKKHKTGLRNFHWALLKGKEYSFERKDYIELCASCHVKYDDNLERRLKLSKATSLNHKNGKINPCIFWKNKTGKNHSKSKAITKIDIITGEEKHYNSLTEAETIDGFKMKSISLCLSGKQKTYKGCNWKIKI